MENAEGFDVTVMTMKGKISTTCTLSVLSYNTLNGFSDAQVLRPVFDSDDSAMVLNPAYRG